MKGSEDRKSEYSNDEERVAKWFCDRGIGGGDDPIGAMIALHEVVAAQRDLLRCSLALAREDLRAALTHIDRELNAIVGGSVNGKKSEADNDGGRGLSRSG